MADATSFEGATYCLRLHSLTSVATDVIPSSIRQTRPCQPYSAISSDVNRRHKVAAPVHHCRRLREVRHPAPTRLTRVGRASLTVRVDGAREVAIRSRGAGSRDALDGMKAVVKGVNGRAAVPGTTEAGARLGGSRPLAFLTDPFGRRTTDAPSGIGPDEARDAKPASGRCRRDARVGVRLQASRRCRRSADGRRTPRPLRSP
jgi:hypothetical protein